MRGRGLLIAAGVIQLVGAAFGVLAAVVMAVAAAKSGPRFSHVLTILAVVYGTIGAIVIPASIGLLRRRRWGWWLSLVTMSVLSLAFLTMPLSSAVNDSHMRVGVAEWIVLFFLGAPICATVGLLIGGRHAVFALSAKTATEPPAATLLGG
jgi:hypothetical protein